MSQSSAAPDIAHNKSPEILSLIGDTPLVEATQFDTGPCRLFLKLENQNPGGSIKDRIALSMIEAAEADGKLQPGGTVIEATAGNTGLGLALVAGAKGYRVLLVIPDKMSQEKISHVRALGADVRIARSDVHADIPSITRTSRRNSPNKFREAFTSINLVTRRTLSRMSVRPVRRFGNKCGTTLMQLWLASGLVER